MKSEKICFKTEKWLYLSYALRYNNLEVLYPHQMGGSSFGTHLNICKFEESPSKDSRAPCAIPVPAFLSIERGGPRSCRGICAELTEMCTEL